MEYHYHLDQLVFPCCLQLAPSWHMRFCLACSTNHETKAVSWLPQIQSLTAFNPQSHYPSLQNHITCLPTHSFFSQRILCSAICSYLQYVNRTPPRLSESSVGVPVALPIPEGLPEATTIVKNLSHIPNCKHDRHQSE